MVISSRKQLVELWNRRDDTTEKRGEVKESGVAGRIATTLSKKYYWLGMTKGIQDYCESYPICQQTKSSIEAPTGYLILLLVSAIP